MKIEPLIYYDLEAYLFDEVSPRFLEQGWLSAFDLFSIVIWKANRAKSHIARKLLRIADTDDLEEASRTLTSALASANSDRERFRVLFQDWDMPLPMLSAILAVLFPRTFSVYDWRICNQLGNFHWLRNRSKVDAVWQGYLELIEAVRSTTPTDLCLRDKDRYLFGQSLAAQLEEDIAGAFKRGAATQ